MLDISLLYAPLIAWQQRHARGVKTKWRHARGSVVKRPKAGIKNEQHGYVCNEKIISKSQYRRISWRAALHYNGIIMRPRQPGLLYGNGWPGLQQLDNAYKKAASDMPCPSTGKRQAYFHFFVCHQRGILLLSMKATWRRRRANMYVIPAHGIAAA